MIEAQGGSGHGKSDYKNDSGRNIISVQVPAIHYNVDCVLHRSRDIRERKRPRHWKTDRLCVVRFRSSDYKTDPANDKPDRRAKRIRR